MTFSPSSLCLLEIKPSRECLKKHLPPMQNLIYKATSLFFLQAFPQKGEEIFLVLFKHKALGDSFKLWECFRKLPIHELNLHPSIPPHPSKDFHISLPDLSKKPEILTFPSQNWTETAASSGLQPPRDGDANHYTRDRRQSTRRGLNTVKGPEKNCWEEIP